MGGQSTVGLYHEPTILCSVYTCMYHIPIKWGEEYFDSGVDRITLSPHTYVQEANICCHQHKNCQIPDQLGQPMSTIILEYFLWVLLISECVRMWVQFKGGKVATLLCSYVHNGPNEHEIYTLLL